MDFDLADVMTIATVITVALLSVSLSVRYSRSRLIDEIKSDINVYVDAAKDKIKEERNDAVKNSGVGAAKNHPPRTSDNGYF